MRCSIGILSNGCKSSRRKMSTTSGTNTKITLTTYIGTITSSGTDSDTSGTAAAAHLPPVIYVFAASKVLIYKLGNNNDSI